MRGRHFWYTRYCVPPLQSCGIAECLRSFLSAFERLNIPVVRYIANLLYIQHVSGNFVSILDHIRYLLKKVVEMSSNLLWLTITNILSHKLHTVGTMCFYKARYSKKLC